MTKCKSENDSMWEREWGEKPSIQRIYSLCFSNLYVKTYGECYCCGDHDGWIIILYTPSTLHCWKVLFTYLRVYEDESSTSGLILYPQRNRLFSWYRLDFIQQSGPQAPPVLGCFHEQLRQFKKKVFQSVFQNSTPKSTR